MVAASLDTGSAAVDALSAAACESPVAGRLALTCFVIASLALRVTAPALARAVASLTGSITFAAGSIVADLTSVRTIRDALAFFASLTFGAAVRVLASFGITRGALSQKLLDRLACSVSSGLLEAHLACLAPLIYTFPVLTSGTSRLTFRDAARRFPGHTEIAFQTRISAQITADASFALRAAGEALGLAEHLLPGLVWGANQARIATVTRVLTLRWHAEPARHRPSESGRQANTRESENGGKARGVADEIPARAPIGEISNQDIEVGLTRAIRLRIPNHCMPSASFEPGHGPQRSDMRQSQSFASLNRRAPECPGQLSSVYPSHATENANTTMT
jgi:hypothetical protein